MHICTCYVCIANSPNCDHSAGGYSARDAMAASILNMIVMPMALPAQINSSHAQMNVSWKQSRYMILEVRSNRKLVPIFFLLL